MKAASSIRVVIVDDQVSAQRRLIGLLNQPPFEWAATCGSVEEALRQVPRLGPEVVLMDIRLPGKSGIDGVRELKQVLPETLVLMVTQFDDSDPLYEALAAGADGYLLKRDSDDQLRAAILDAQAGGAPMSRSIARKVLQHFRSSPRQITVAPMRSAIPADIAEQHSLTAREHEILLELATGATAKDIAQRLHLQAATVRVHLRSIYAKLHVRSATAAVAKLLGHEPRH